MYLDGILTGVNSLATSLLDYGQNGSILSSHIWTIVRAMFV